MLTDLQMPPRRSLSLAAYAVALAGLLIGCGDPALRTGHDALGQGRYAEAIAAFEDVRRRLPTQHPAGAHQSAHRALAGQLMAGGRCDDGRAQLERAEALGPTLLADHRALYDCVTAHPTDDARRLADLEKLVALGEMRVDVHLEMMRLQLGAERWADAVRHVPMLERRYALTLADHEALIPAWERAGRLVGAHPHLLKVLQVRPDDLLARLKLAEVEEARGDRRAAGAIYARLTAEQPDNLAIWMRVAAFHRRNGDPVAARRALEQARALQQTAEDPRGALRPLPRSKR